MMHLPNFGAPIEPGSIDADEVPDDDGDEDVKVPPPA